MNPLVIVVVVHRDGYVATWGFLSFCEIGGKIHFMGWHPENGWSTQFRNWVWRSPWCQQAHGRIFRVSKGIWRINEKEEERIKTLYTESLNGFLRQEGLATSFTWEDPLPWSEDQERSYKAQERLWRHLVKKPSFSKKES